MHKIIEKLASKELSFGCSVLVPTRSGGFWKTKQKVIKTHKDKVIVSRGKTGIVTLPKSKVEILGHPVYIGDVLERMLEEIQANTWEGKRLSYNDRRDNQVIAGKPRELIDLWGKCGFNKSLQEIEEESGYDNFCERCDVEREKHREGAFIKPCLKKGKALDAKSEK